MTHDPIYTVSSLTASIKQSLEGGFPFVWVRGQVVNVSRPSSGHLYFSLRDENASLAAVWFRGNQQAGEAFDPLTGEVYEGGPRPSLAQSLKNGQEVVCAGRLTVYGARGVYQLVVELGQDVGLGKLQADFEHLKKKLAAAGYFEQSRKRPLPLNPKRVAVITAPSGAAVHDFLRIAEARGFGAEIRIFPALMQGEEAPQQIIGQMTAVASANWAEVIVLIRGGGSLEDLWAFNDENLATAVRVCPLPVLAGIGHEVDVTLTDMTADVRAATPTHAAQILWQDRREYHETLGTLRALLDKHLSQALHTRLAHIEACSRIVLAHSPFRRLLAWEQQLSSGEQRLGRAVARMFHTKQEKVLELARNFDKPPPSLTMKADLVKQASQRIQRSIEALLRDRRQKSTALAQSLCKMPYAITRKQACVDQVAERLAFAGERVFSGALLRLERARLSLEVFDPQKPLQRGYALVYKEDGSLVRLQQHVAPGDSLRIEIHDGSIAAAVKKL